MGEQMALRPHQSQNEEETKLSPVAQQSLLVSSQVQVVRFRGRPMVLDYEGFPHYVPLRREMFDRLAYPLLGGVSRSRMGDIFSFLGNTAVDLTPNDRYVLFGSPEVPDDGSEPAMCFVWDQVEATLLPLDQAPSIETIPWRSPYAPMRTQGKRLQFILDLAGGDTGLYDDIMQSLAPLIMHKKPDGVIWWVGDGANGKSTLMDALYRIFPGQLSSITVKRLVDGRDTPSLNGTLANVVKESSEGRVDDTEIYKSIGTHENFRVHKFHSQDDVEIRGNLHHIFSANSVPTFNDKGWSARRRTFIVPFTQRFESDPTFEERTFTPEMFGQLIMEMAKYANQLHKQGYKYKWSAKTLAAKAAYDVDANNAEEYVRELVENGVVAFEGFNMLKMNYDNWCAENGYVPLGITNIRRAATNCGFERLSTRDSAGNVQKQYRLRDSMNEALIPFGMAHPGLFTRVGWRREEAATEPELPVTEPTIPEMEPEPAEPPKKPVSILNGKW